MQYQSKTRFGKDGIAIGAEKQKLVPAVGAAALGARGPYIRNICWTESFSFSAEIYAGGGGAQCGILPAEKSEKRVGHVLS